MKTSFLYKRDFNGFTLIELLLVIAIIGVLSSFLIANFIGAKARARDAQRKSDLKQIQAALELYRADQDTYPTDAEMSACNVQFAMNGTIYMKIVPCDPNTKNPYTYTQLNGGTSYSLVACLENENDSQADVNNHLSNNSACTNGTWSMTVSSP
jgi:general secretion pathway protein G